MNTIKIDYKKPALSLEQLAELRKEATGLKQESLQKLKRFKVINRLMMTIFLLVLIVAVAVVFGTVVGVAAVIAVIAAVTVTVSATGSAAGITAVAAGITAVAVAAGITGPAAGIATVFCTVATIYITSWHKTQIDKMHMSNRTDDLRLSALCELNSNEYSNQCIEYDKLRSDSVVEQYHQKIIAMSRKPIVMEYEAAKRWCENTESREKEEARQKLAHEACERMAV